MTAADPVASRLLDKTGVYSAGQGGPLAREMIIERGFPSPYQPDKGRSAVYRTGLGPDSPRDTLFATLVGNQRESSGESRSQTHFLIRGVGR